MSYDKEKLDALDHTVLIYLDLELDLNVQGRPVSYDSNLKSDL